MAESLTTISLQHILEELIRMPTVSTDQAANKEALDWIAWRLTGLPVHIAPFENAGFHSLYLSGRPGKRHKLLLLAHLDVVPGGYQSFLPTVEKGRLYGRGAFDMKFAVACYLKLFLELGDSLPEYDLGMMINTDEEVGGLNGSHAMLADGFGAEIVLNPDGAPDWAIERGAKGYHEIMIESFGKTAHGGHAWDGKNAIDQLNDYLRDLRDLFPSEPCGDEDHEHDVLNVGMIEGGAASNQVPGYAKAVVTLRTLPGESVDDVKDRFGRLRSQHHNIQITYNFGNTALSTDVQNPHIQLFAKLVEQEVGKKPAFVMSHGASDARYFDMYNIPVLVSKPTGGPQHADEEWIGLESLDTFYAVMKKFVEEVAHNKP